jgi:hypothetical protein
MVRHPKRSIRNAASGGVSAAPRRPPLKYAPKDVERSATGTHRVNAVAVAGDSADYGPQQLAAFHHATDDDERLLYARRAYELVQKLLSLV